MRRLIKIVLLMVMMATMFGCNFEDKDDSSKKDSKQEEINYSKNILLSINNGASGYGTLAECTDATIMIYTDKMVRVFMNTQENPEIASFALSDEDYEKLCEIADPDEIYELEVENDTGAMDGSSYYIELYDENDERVVFKGGYMPMGDDFWEMYDAIKDVLEPYGIVGYVDAYRETMESDFPNPGENIVAETPKYLNVEFEYNWDSSYGEAAFMYASYNTIHLVTTEYPALTTAVDAFNAEYVASTQSYIDEIEQNAINDYKEYGPEPFWGPYVYESEMFLKRADDEVLSAEEIFYIYQGGAHGATSFNAVNFNVQTGAEIQLEDVITDMNSLPGILAAETLAKYPDITYWTDSLEGTFQEYITPTNSEYAPEFTWTLGYEGVTFCFGSYEIGSYADGIQQVTVLYSKYPEIFNSRYFENVDQNYALKADAGWGGTNTDINGDGVTDYILVTANYNAEMDYNESFNVIVNGNTYTQDSYFFDLDTYLVKSNGNSYLYVQRTMESDYQVVSVFKITENSVEFVDEFVGGLGSFSNSLDFGVTKRMDLLSTYTAVASCYVGPDGMPVEKDNIYRIQGDLSITSTVEITAELLDEQGNLTVTSYTFPAGTEFKFVATDGVSYVDMLADDGQRCRFFTTPDWPATVNGMNAEDSFETLWYAG